jgi:hypothetical protein
MALGIGAIVLCFTIALILMSNQMSSFSSSFLLNRSRKLANSDLATSTLTLYYLSAQNYHIIHYPNHYLLVDPTFNLALSLLLNEQRVNSIINEVLTKHLRN